MKRRCIKGGMEYLPTPGVNINLFSLNPLIYFIKNLNIYSFKTSKKLLKSNYFIIGNYRKGLEVTKI